MTKKSTKLNIAIIGAGLTGLVAGYELSRKGHKITIFEKNDDIGGLMGGFKIGNTSLEKAYHHIFKTDKYIIKIIGELGLGSKLRWYPEKTALYYDKQMHPFMGAVDLLKFRPLSIFSKVRLGLVKVWLEKDNNHERYLPTPAYLWMKKWCGEEAYRVVWEPLLRGKFGDRYKDVSMAWLWARIHTRGNSGQLGYLTGGFRQVADELAKAIKKNRGEIKMGIEADFKKIERDYDKVIYTGAAKNIGYLGAINLVFATKQNLSPYYWHNINDPQSPFLAFIQHTNLINRKMYGGKNIYYMGTYLPHDHKYFTSDDKTIKKDFFDYLSNIYRDFDRKQISQIWLFRFKNAQHIVTTDYKVPPYKLSDKVYQANFAQIFPEDRGTNFAVREGQKVAKMME